jgi:hypothetical protein
MTMITWDWLGLPPRPLTPTDADASRQGTEAPMTPVGLVTRTVARIRLTGKMANDHLVCPPPVSP